MQHSLRQEARRPQVLYVCYEFPVLTQTFTAGEIHALKGEGIALEVVSCRRARERTAGMGATDVPVRHLPSPVSRTTAKALAGWFVRRPLRCLSLLGAVATGSYRDERVRCWARGFDQLLRGARLAEDLRRAGERPHLHAQFLDAASTVAFVAARLLDTTFSVTNHTAYNPYLLRPKLRHASAVFSISEFDRRLLSAQSRGVGRERIRVLYQGIGLGEWEGPARRKQNGALEVLCVAALREKKGHEILLHAMRELLETGLDLRLTLVGDGPRRGRIDRLVEALGLADRVTLAGAEPPARVKERLAGTDLFVLAATRARNGDLDGIPISLMEAMAAGAPVVSTRISGIPELIRDGVEGLLATPGDAASLARRIREAVSDPAAAGERADRARKRVRERHDRRRSAGTLADFFREVVV